MHDTHVMVDSNTWHKLCLYSFFNKVLVLGRIHKNYLNYTASPNNFQIVKSYYTRPNYLNCVGVKCGTQLCLCCILKGTLVPSTKVYLQYISTTEVTDASKICTLYFCSQLIFLTMGKSRQTQN